MTHQAETEHNVGADDACVTYLGHFADLVFSL